MLVRRQWQTFRYTILQNRSSGSLSSWRNNNATATSDAHIGTDPA